MSSPSSLVPSAEYSRLRSAWLQAKAQLESSRLWNEWKAAVILLQETAGQSTSASLTPLALTPEDAILLTDSLDPWDSLDPIAAEYAKVTRALTEKRRVDDLKQQLERSDAWQSLVRLDLELKAHLVQETNRIRLALGTPITLTRPRVHPVDEKKGGSVHSVDGIRASSASPPPMSLSSSQPQSRAESSSASPAVSSVDESSAARGAERSAASSAAGSAAAGPSRRECSSALGGPGTRIGGGEVELVASPAVSSGKASSSKMSPLSPFNTHSSSSSSSKKDAITQLTMPGWCTGIEQDPHVLVAPLGLGLVSAEVYQDMCGSERHQVQRLSSNPDPKRSLFAAVIRAREFEVKSHFHPLTDEEVDRYSHLLNQTISGWTDEQLSNCIPNWDSTIMQASTYLEEHLTDIDVLYLWRAVTSTTSPAGRRAPSSAAPRVYVVRVQRDPGTLSVAIFGDQAPGQPDTPCIILYEHLSATGSHFENISWKRAARGPSRLRTLFVYSDPIIQALQTWFVANDTTLPDKRTTPRKKRGRAPSPGAGERAPLSEPEMSAADQKVADETPPPRKNRARTLPASTGRRGSPQASEKEDVTGSNSGDHNRQSGSGRDSGD